MILMPAVIIIAVLYGASIATVIFHYTQKKFRKDFDNQEDKERLRELGIQRLILRRYRTNTYMGSVKRTRKEISLDAVLNERSGPFNSVEEELHLYGIKGSREHLVCNLPYTAENKNKLLKIMEEYNKSTLKG